MIHVKEAVVVEGKYDKIKLSSLIDGLILPTNGFRIFKDPKQMALFRSLADVRGLLILTDSDSAGFLIRHYLSGCIAPEKIRHAYIPDILGKEKRKDRPSKEGKLGVEGMPAAILKEALLRAGVGIEEEPLSLPPRRLITKADLYACGLSGGPNSAKKRAALLKRLSLPEYLSANVLPEVLNSILSYDELVRITAEL